MRKLFIFLALAVLFGGLAYGQGATEGILEVVVTQEDGSTPIVGAVVTALGPQAPRTAVSDNNGVATFRGLTPGKYQVKAEAEGYSTIVQSDVDVFSGRRTQLPFALPKGLSEEITVTSVAPLVDLKSTTTGAQVKVDDFAPYVPLGRNLTSTFAIAPGVSDGGSIGAANQSISGSSGLENAYFVDGVNITNSGYGAIGAYSLVYGSLGTGVTYDFLEEVEVKTGGFEAEFGQAGGGVVNSVVKSGTNDLTFDINWYETLGSLEGGRRDRTLAPNRSNRTETDRTDIGLSVGGPVIKDQLFYFLAYNPISVDESFRLTSGDAENGYDLDADGTFDDFFGVGEQIVGGRVPSEVTRSQSIDNYAAKIAWYLTPNQKFEGTLFGDPSEGDVGPWSPTQFFRNLANPSIVDPSIGATGLDWGGDQYSFKYHGVWSPNFFTEVQFSHKEAEFLEFGPGVGARSIYNATADDTLGGAGFYENLADETDQFSVKFTNVVGPVEIKYGWQRDEIDWRQPKTYSGPTYTSYLPRLVEDVPIDSDGDGSVDGMGIGLMGDGSLGSSYLALESGTGAALTCFDTNGDGACDEYDVTRTAFGPEGDFTNAVEDNFFAQVSWDVTPNVNVKAGFRHTTQDLAGAGNFTLPVQEIGGVLAAGSTDYSSRTYEFDSETAPRLGITWDVLGDGRHKVYANWGEYYQRIPSDLAVRQFSNEVGIESELFFDDGLTSPIFESDCFADLDGDGVYDDTVSCHTNSSTGAHPGVILDGTQASRDYVEGIGIDFDSVSNGEATKLPFVEEYLLGYAWEINDFTALEVRYINREMGRTLEDVQFASNEQIWNTFGEAFYGLPTGVEVFEGHGQGSFGAYVLTNPGDNVNAAQFPNPVRDYEAIEVIFTRRMHKGWMAYINYRFGRLRGNFEGSFRNDNGQSDPFITSLYDLPAASILDDGSTLASQTLAGQYTIGPLNTDRRHILNAFASKQFEFGLNVGARFTMRSGQPRFPLFAHPTYRNSGEIPGFNPTYWWVGRYDTDGDGAGDYSAVVTDDDATTSSFGDADVDGDGNVDSFDFIVTGPRLFSYDVVKRDFFGRNPWTYEVDLKFSYDWELGQGKLTAVLDIFNLFGDNTALTFDDDVENRPGTPNRNFLKPTTFQAPRAVRLGARYSW